MRSCWPFLFLCFPLLCLAQTDNAVVDNYLDKAKAYNKTNIDSAVYFSAVAYTHAATEKDTLLMGQASYFYTHYLIRKGDFKLAEKLLDFNVLYASNMNDHVLGGTHYNYGNRYYLEQVYDKAITHYLKSLSYYQEVNNTQGLMRSNLQLGVVYEKLEKKELAAYFYDTSLTFSDKAKIVHTKEITYGENIVSQNIEVSKNMLEALEKEPDNATKAIILYNLGKSYINAKKWSEAIRYFKESLALKTALGIQEQKDQNLFYIGASYLALGEFTEAIDYLLQARELSEKREQKAEIEASLQRAYEASGDYKNALTYAKRYGAIKDSLNALQERDRIAEITAQFETEKQAAEIALLESNNALQSSKLSNQATIIWATIIGVLLLLVALFFGYRRYQTKQKLQFSEMTRKLLQMQLNPHFLFNALNGIQYFIKQNDTKKSTKYISNFSGLMRNILENSVEKFISIEEDAETITDFLALQQLVHNNSFLYTVSIEETLDAENLCIPPMFTQPFVENAIIHGVQGMKDGNISVHYGLKDDTITVTINDNGKGFSETSTHANSLHKSMGTSITRQRMENLLKTENYPVTLEVTSKKEADQSHGTTVLLTFLKKFL